jgi:hypothetical protein
MLSDNGNGYRSFAWHDTCAELDIQRRRPQTNGKAEALVKTLLREWAHRFAYPSSLHRARTLPGYLRWYNHHRPHNSIGGQPPISRVSQDPRPDEEAPVRKRAATREHPGRGSPDLNAALRSEEVLPIGRSRNRRPLTLSGVMGRLGCPVWGILRALRGARLRLRRTPQHEHRLHQGSGFWAVPEE